MHSFKRRVRPDGQNGPDCGAAGGGCTIADCGHEPSGSFGTEQITSALAWSMFATPAPTISIAAAIVVRVAAKTFWRGPQGADCRAAVDQSMARVITQLKDRMCDSYLTIYSTGNELAGGALHRVFDDPSA